MEKAVLFSCVLILVIQIARAQNLAALFGLGGFDMAESQTPGSSSCPYQVHPDRRKFNQLVNNRMMTQECAPGTMFVLSKCSCDNIPKGGNGGGPMPGSNPRMEAGLGADRNSMMSALMSQLSGALGGAFPPPTPRAPRPSPRNNSPMNTNQLNSIRQKVTSGIRPDQSNGGSVAKHFQKPPSAPSPNSQFNLDPSTGLTSVVDPSLLPDILNNGIPPAVKKMLDRASKPPTSRPSPTRRPYPTEPPSGRPPTKRPYPTEPPSRRPPTKKQSPPTPSSQVLPPGGLPGDVLKMLQKSMQPPRGASKKVNPGRSKQRKTKSPPTASNIRRKPTPSQTTNTRRPTSLNRAAGPRPTRRPTSLNRAAGPRPTRRPTPHNRAAGPRPDPLAGLMAQLTGGMKKGPEPSRRSRTRKDPLAALLGN